MLYKSIEFKNVDGQRVKVSEIPVLANHHRYYFMVDIRLQSLISSLYNQLQGKTHVSFREYLKQKIKWSEYKELFDIESYRNNA
ncbi:Protein of unknown function [Litchfieldia salsa]|uniref:DUF2535 domain-containing protein n=1 Tax=Litchfieldia salsa TaxID=930152 RepID=A0A1H0PFV1_9BACI|nr:Protein of unknown function [Litchfieldia salsa]